MCFVEGLSSKKNDDTGDSQLHITRYILPFWDARGDTAHMKMRMTKAPVVKNWIVGKPPKKQVDVARKKRKAQV